MTLTFEGDSSVAVEVVAVGAVYVEERLLQSMITDSLDMIFILSQLGCSLYLLRQTTVKALNPQDWALKSNNVVRRRHIY